MSTNDNDNDTDTEAIAAESSLHVPAVVEDMNNGTRTHTNSRSGALIVRCGFTVLGIGFLLPWNAFISASAYFENRIHTCGTGNGNGNGTGTGNNFMLWFGLVYNLSGVTSLAFMLLSQKRREKTQRLQIISSSSSSLAQPTPLENDRQSQSQSQRQRQSHPQCKTVMKALSCFFLTMLLTTTLVLLPSPSLISPNLFQTISLLSAAICGTAGAFISTGIVAFASDFPPQLGIQPFISGQAVGGVVISFLDLVMFGMEDSASDSDSDTSAAHFFWEEHCHGTADAGATPLQEESHSCEPYRIDWGAFTYFLVGTIFIATCMGLYVYLDQSPVTHYYRNIRRGETETETDVDVDVDLDVSDTSCVVEESTRTHTHTRGTALTTECVQDEEDNETRINFNAADIMEQDHDHDHGSAVQQNSLTEPLLPLHIDIEEDDTNININISTDGGAMIQSQQQQHQHQQATAESENESMAAFVWNYVRTPSTSVFVTFLITITIFPSWTTKLESVHECQDPSSRLHNDLFVPCFIVLFNVCDLCGRTATGFVNVNGNTNLGQRSATPSDKLSKWLSVASYARVGFLPIFLLCKASDSAFVPPVQIFANDWFPILFTAVFAFSNGFISTLSFVQAAIVTPAGEEVQQVASTILNFAVGLGLMSGSLVSFLYNYVGTRTTNLEREGLFF